MSYIMTLHKCFVYLFKQLFWAIKLILFERTRLMNFLEYQKLFDAILTTDGPAKPYDKPAYINYVKLNQSRMSRWVRTMELQPDLIDALNDIEEPQHWIIITEPWCGDAAHSVPFLVAIAEKSPKVTYEIQLRDAEPFLINDYLTNGGKGIPKMVARDQHGIDLFTWGPRPNAAQDIFDKMKSEGAVYDEITLKLQAWYNADKGHSLQSELLALVERQTV